MHAAASRRTFIARSIRWFAAGCAAITGLATDAATAAPQSVADIANDQSADRQQMLEQGARQEGALMIYTTGTQIQPLIDRFTQKYPFIHVEMPRGAAEDVARQALQEYAAGVYLVDVFELNSPALIIPRDQGILQPFRTPESVDNAPDSIEPGRHWIVARESYLGIGYNTKLISAQDAPKTYRDLLDQKWKGKMAISGSNGTAGNWIGAMIISEGEDYVRALGEQDIRVYTVLARALANLTISGEAPLSPTTYDSHVLVSQAQGAPIAWNAPGPVPVTDGSLAIAAAAPHPHAAMLFIDFALSKEGQLIYRDLGYTPARAGVGEDRYPGLKKIYLSNRPNYLAEYEHWVDLLQQIFIRRSNAAGK